jgi:hypothetical protein
VNRPDYFYAFRATHAHKQWVDYTAKACFCQQYFLNFVFNKIYFILNMINYR